MKIMNAKEDPLQKGFFTTIGVLLAGVLAAQKIRERHAENQRSALEYSVNLKQAKKDQRKALGKLGKTRDEMRSAGAGEKTLGAFEDPPFTWPPPPQPQLGTKPDPRPVPTELDAISAHIGQIKDVHKEAKGTLETMPPTFHLSMRTEGKNEMSQMEFFEEQIKKNLGLSSSHIKRNLSKAQFAGNPMAKIEDKYSWSPGALQEQDIMNPNSVQFPEMEKPAPDERLNQLGITQGLTNEDFIEHMSRSLGLSRGEIVKKLGLADFRQNPFWAKSGPDWKREKLTDAEISAQKNVPPVSQKKLSDESPF